MAHKTYKDFIPPEGGRSYSLTANPDGTTKITDVTQYTQEGDTWGAGDANALWEAVDALGGINATAVYEDSTVKITAPEGIVVVIFLAPSDCKAGDRYTLNGDALTLTDLNGETVEDAWKQGAPVQFTISGNKAFFKAGGGGKVPADLPPLLPNFALDFSGTTVTVTANKLPLNDKTSMLAGGVWVLASTIPDSPKGAIVKEWSQSDLIDSTQDTESSEVVTWTYPNWSAGEPIYCRQYTYNEKGQYNTSLYGGLVSTEDVTFKLPEFTGNHAIFGDETQGRIELYESGTLTLSPGTYDFFLVGGGSGSPQPVGYTSSIWGGSGGGSGGYTFTEKGFVVDRELNFPVIIGAGGVVKTAGANTFIDLVEKTITANGGTNQFAPGADGDDYDTPSMRNGYSGGSGGASMSGQNGPRADGGSNGSNGVSSKQGRGTWDGGLGQGTTTRAFGEELGTLYAGGGGGASYGDATPGLGGAGGGGNAGTNVSGHLRGSDGTANTGGGGGGGKGGMHGGEQNGSFGGSGIIIVRWNNAG